MPYGRWSWRTRFDAFGKDWTIFINPPSDRFLRDIDPALGHQFFNLTQAQIKSKIQPDNTLNHIRMKTAAMINGDFHLANLTLNDKTASLCDKTIRDLSDDGKNMAINSLF